MEIKNVSADFNPCYDPSRSNNGGGYWQPCGTCTVTLEDGSTMSATYADTSCGDFGDRWMAVLTVGGEQFVFAEDEVGTSCERQEQLAVERDEEADRFFDCFGVEAKEVVDSVAKAIGDAAWDMYLKMRDD